jgi:predicted ester cyclase
MSNAQNEEIARRFVKEVWNEQKLDVVDELYSPDYVGHWFLPGGETADRESAKEFIRSVHRGFPDYEMNIEFLHASDDEVTVGFTGSGTHEGEFMGIPPEATTPMGGSIPGQITMHIEDGRVVEGWATWDALGMLQALGVVPTEMGEVPPSADD